MPRPSSSAKREAEGAAVVGSSAKREALDLWAEFGPDESSGDVPNKDMVGDGLRLID